jgi:4'-phosphopantetheinyl transferase
VGDNPPLLTIVIHWLMQSITAHPDLASGQASPDLLSTEETAYFNGFSVLKRRQDWLLGRWTTKLLLQAIIQQQSGRSIPLHQISILPGKDGAPQASFAAPFADLDSTFSVSISHSHGSSLCAAVTRPDWPLGADIERIEPRSPSFAADFFTGEEQAQIRDAAPEMKETLVTAVWSGKEAALKAIHEGLRSDTRVVSCHFALPLRSAGIPASPPPGKWKPFCIEWQREADRRERPELNGWWMVSERYVLTLATTEKIDNNHEGDR